MLDSTSLASGGRSTRAETAGWELRLEAGRGYSRAEQKLLALVRISQAMMAEKSLEGALRLTAEAARVLAGARWGACGYESPEGLLRVELSPGPQASSPGQPETMHPEQVRPEQVHHLYREVSTPEPTAGPAFRLSGRSLRRRLPGGLPAENPSFASLLGTRLVDCRERPCGLILAGEKENAAAFSSRDEALQIELAAIVSLALQHFQALEDAKRLIGERSAMADRRSRQLQALALELSEAEETERRRIGGLLHEDLQQLLASMRYQLKVLQRSMKGEEPAAGALALHIQQLLDESLLKCRRLSEELSPPVLRLGGLVMALEWLAEQMQTKYGLAVQVEAQEWLQQENEPLRIFLFRAVQELLLNVVKHSGVRAARVQLRGAGDRVEIAVSDEGRGFDFRIAEGRSGSGLHSIIERIQFFGGSIAVESAAGRGSRLRLSLPLQGLARPARSRRIPVGTRKPAPLRRERVRADEESLKVQVLLVDDHRLMRQGLTTLLGNQGDIQVIGEAADGREAIELAHRLRPDVVLMDVSMPGMDGIEATRCIKAELPEIRVIGLSMFEEREVAERMLAAGAETYLSKAGPSESLVEAIRMRLPR